MSIFKKFTSALNSEKRSILPKSVSLNNLKSPKNEDLVRPKTPPLEQFISERQNSGSIDLGGGNQLSWNRKSKLSKTTKEVLHDPPALAYFIQYLEARDAVQLVKFWLDVESFKVSASAVISTKFVGSHRIPAIPEDKLESQISGTSSLADNIESADSFDSGLGKHELDQEQEIEEDTCQATFSSTVQHPEHAISRAELLVKTRTEDAVKIYQRYIAPDCSRPLHLPTEFKKEIVERICAESGQVSSDCFNHAQDKVVDILEKEYFPDFLKSEFHAKHLVDILTGGQVMIADILYNDTALAHFMEFMETQSKIVLMEFWLTASNFHQTLQSDTSQSDAMVLYEKYFSMQATTPLGFNDSVRLQIENNICSEKGPDQTCFDMPLEIILQYLERNYLQKFLISPMFKNYIKELIGTITASPRSLSSVTPGASCAGSSAFSRDSDDRSDCSSEFSVSHVSHVSTPCHNNNMIRSTNTLLAMSSSSTSTPLINNNNDSPGDVPDHPDTLWRRTPVRNDIGRISSFGRYQPGWDVAPDSSRAQGTKQSSRISKAVKKLVLNEDHEKMKEEMAWQVAEMFVKEVTSVTMAEDQINENKDASKLTMSQSFNESFSLADLNIDLDNLELTPSKYF